MTPAEINRRVAEIAGWSELQAVRDVLSGWIGHHADYTIRAGPKNSVPSSAHSLDAIVPVVREWCEKRGGGNIAFHYSDQARKQRWKDGPWEVEIIFWDGRFTDSRTKRSDNPATALSLALIAAVEATGA